MNNSTKAASTEIERQVAQELEKWESWEGLIQGLEEHIDLEATAKSSGAIQRYREVNRASDLLRMVLAYAGCDWSLRTVSVWCGEAGIGEMSNVAVLKRLQNSAAWLELLARALLEREKQTTGGIHLRFMDASVINPPGEKGTAWRLHCSLDIANMRISDLDVTNSKGAESLTRVSAQRNEIVVADRGYAYVNSFLPLLEAKCPFIVRCNWQNIPLWYEHGEVVDMVALMRSMKPGQVIDRAVCIHTAEGSKPMRLILGALPKDKAAETRRKKERSYRKKGKTPLEATLLATGFVILLTNLPLYKWTAAYILQIYRWRWQIEVYFKRLKSVLKLDSLRAKHEQLARVYIWAKLLMALLLEPVQCILRHAARRDAHNLSRPVSEWRLMDILKTCFHRLIDPGITPARLYVSMLNRRTDLCDTPRRRTQQLTFARVSLANRMPVNGIWNP